MSAIETINATATTIDRPRAVATWKGSGRPPRVALFNVTSTTKLGGVETFVWDLARQLVLAGLQVDLIGGRGPIHLEAPGVHVIRAPYIAREGWRRLPLLARQYGATKLLERLSFGFASFATLLRGHYDLLHIQKPFDLPVAAAVRRATSGRTRVVFGCHGRDFFPGDALFTGSVDATVACSATNAAEVAARYGLQPEVIYNGIDLERFTPRPPNAALRESIVADADRPLLLVAGRLVRWKGFEYAIEALRHLTDEPAPVLAIVGDGPYRKALAALANRAGVRDRVAFLGQRDYAEMPSLYAVADIVLGTSFVNETFGISLCEALAAQRPVIASDFGGFREIIRPGETGLLVPPQDPRALAAAIATLLRKPALRARLGQAGRRDIADRFAWPAVVQRVLAAYQAALS